MQKQIYRRLWRQKHKKRQKKEKGSRNAWDNLLMDREPTVAIRSAKQGDHRANKMVHVQTHENLGSVQRLGIGQEKGRQPEPKNPRQT